MNLDYLPHLIVFIIIISCIVIGFGMMILQLLKPEWFENKKTNQQINEKVQRL